MISRRSEDISPKTGVSSVTRPTIHDTLFTVAEAWALRSTCLRGSAGCVITTPSGGVLSQGYNGAPRGLPHCTEAGCLIENDHCIRTVHAEMNAIIWAANQGIALDGGVLYSTVRPCIRCAVAVVQAGISCVYYDQPYGSDDVDAVRKLFFDAKVWFIHRGDINND